MNLRHVDACPFLPEGGEQLQLNRSFNCSYSDLEKDLSLDTDLEERSSDAAKKRTSNELVIDLPETAAPSTAPSAASSRPHEKPAFHEANKENLRTIEVSLSSGSRIEQRLVKNCEMPGGQRHFVNGADSEDTDFDAYSSDSEFEEGDGRCSKCSLENRMENRRENQTESGYLQNKGLSNYHTNNNGSYKTGQPFASKEFNFQANPLNAVGRFRVQSGQFGNGHQPTNIVMPRLKTEI